VLLCWMLQGSSGAPSLYILCLNNSNQPLGTMSERQVQGSDSVLTGVRKLRQCLRSSRPASSSWTKPEFHKITPQLVRRVCSLRCPMESFQSAKWLLTASKASVGMQSVFLSTSITYTSCSLPHVGTQSDCQRPKEFQTYVAKGCILNTNSSVLCCKLIYNFETQHKV
jgi:hypothetical protein